MTASAPGASFTTQASNFSLRRRSADAPEVTAASIPNWRKHSVSRYRDDSLRSTRATRAAVFLVARAGAKAVPVAFGMWFGEVRNTKTILARAEGGAKTPKGRVGGVLRYQDRELNGRYLT